MDVFPKFIIEGDRLVMSKVTYHKHLLIADNDASKVKGGGWFRYIEPKEGYHLGTFVFYGDSHDYGKAKFEDIIKCVESNKVFTHKFNNNSIARRFNFVYDTGTELIELKTK